MRDWNFNILHTVSIIKQVSITNNPYEGLKLAISWDVELMAVFQLLIIPMRDWNNRDYLLFWKLRLCVSITNNPYEGLKRSMEFFNSKVWVVSITNNPYEGLKRGMGNGKGIRAFVSITNNPYEGLKHRIKFFTLDKESFNY